MATKTWSQKANGGHGAEALIETPSQQKLPRQPVAFPAAAETEAEEVKGGFLLLRPEEADREVSNMIAGEGMAYKTEAFMEEPGFEASIDERPLPDAFYASYSELMYQEDIQELPISLENRLPITDTEAFPWRAICKLVITARDNTRWAGTGFLVGPRTVITAGHCVYLHEHGGFPRSIEVIPGLNGHNRPFGSGIARTFKTVLGWTQSRDRKYDYGAIILPNAYRPGDVTGFLGLAVKDEEYLQASILNLADFPAPKPILSPELMQRRTFAGQVQGAYTEEPGQQQGEPAEGAVPMPEVQQMETGQPQPLTGQQQQPYRTTVQISKQLFFKPLRARIVSQRLIQYDTEIKGGQSGAPVWIKAGNNRYVVGIHTAGDRAGNAATRITPQVLNNLRNWKAFGM